MIFLPYNKFKLVVDEEKRAVLQNLTAMIAPKSFLKRYFNQSTSTSTAPRIFIGEIYGGSFDISLRVYSRFCPVIRGYIESDLSNTQLTNISVSVNFNPISMVFLIFWFIAAPVCFKGAVESNVTLYALFTLFPIFAMYSTYCYELNRSRAKFIAIFSGKIIGIRNL